MEFIAKLIPTIERFSELKEDLVVKNNFLELRTDNISLDFIENKKEGKFVVFKDNNNSLKMFLFNKEITHVDMAILTTNNKVENFIAAGKVNRFGEARFDSSSCVEHFKKEAPENEADAQLLLNNINELVEERFALAV